MKNPTFAAARGLLLELGFEDRSAGGKSHRFEYPLPDTIVSLPAYGEDEIVSPGNLFGVQILLDYRGLMSPEDFAQALRERSLAG